MVAAALGKNLGSPMPKWSNDSYLQKNQELQTTCTLSMSCQINVANKHLVPPLNIIIIIIIIIITLFQVDEIKIQNVIQVTYTRQLLCKICSAN